MGLGKKREGLFLRGEVDMPMHTMVNYHIVLNNLRVKYKTNKV